MIGTGCATGPGGQPDSRDPFERINRVTFRFNDALDRRIVRPAARGYKKVVPRPVQQGLTNFFENLETPSVLANNVLQGKLRPAAHDFGRFMLNSTVGVGGLLDPATPAGLDRNDEDFGQTLGRWGLGAGSYLVVPFYGPTTIRDGAGTIVDRFATPTHYLEDDSTRWGITAFGLFERRVRLLDTDSVLERTFDPYSFVRNAYLQRRAYLVSDGEVAEEEFEDPEAQLDDAPTDEPTPPE
jgi:phospholipid-binding lipoprotein MlaA